MFGTNGFMRVLLVFQFSISLLSIIAGVVFSNNAKYQESLEMGFNPNYYFGATGGLSFYLPGYSRLFILGGINGDVNSSDTDTKTVVVTVKHPSGLYSTREEASGAR